MKYNNVLREFRKKGLIQENPSSTRKRKVEKEESVEDLVKKTVETVGNISRESVEEKKIWLSRFNQPWDIVERNWLHTSRLRRDALLACDTQLKLKILMRDEWPLLSNIEYAPFLVTLMM